MYETLRYISGDICAYIVVDLKLLVYAALSYQCMRHYATSGCGHQATSVCGLKLLVYETLRYISGDICAYIVVCGDIYTHIQQYEDTYKHM